MLAVSTPQGLSSLAKRRRRSLVTAILRRCCAVLADAELSQRRKGSSAGERSLVIANVRRAKKELAASMKIKVVPIANGSLQASAA
jgi:hypothetical protein